VGSGHLLTGEIGEDAACSRYRSSGFEILARNWRCSLGEIDIVARRRDLIVFCEVKTRRGSAFGGGWEAVTATKRRKLRALAEAFLLSTRTASMDVRFDVASVAIEGERRSITIFEDAF
jgi:putative endonuclease